MLVFDLLAAERKRPRHEKRSERHCPERVLGEVWERVLELLDRGALCLERDIVQRELNVHRRECLAQVVVEDAQCDDVPALRAVLQVGLILQVGLAWIDPGAVWRRNGGHSRGAVGLEIVRAESTEKG